jgi:hypothetical protein
MDQFTAEERFFLSCLAQLAREQTTPIVAPGELDWDRLLQLFDDHNLAPVLDYCCLSTSIPPEVIPRITHKVRLRRMRAVLMTEDFRDILIQFRRAGIPVIPIKGIALAHTVYPSVTLRYFDDLDLLVPQDAGDEALKVLRQLDYVPHPRAPRPDWHHLRPFVHQKHNTMVEIHTDLVRRAGDRWPVAGVWERAVPAQIAEQNTLLMTVEDALVLVVLHARHNLYNRLFFLLDAVLLSQKLKPGRLPELLVLVDKAGCRCALTHVLVTAERLLEVGNVPRAPCSSPRRWLSKRVESWQNLTPPRSTLRQGPLPKLIELLLMDNLGDSLRLGGRLVFPPEEFVRQSYDGRGRHVGGYWGRLREKITLTAKQLFQAARSRD